MPVTNALKRLMQKTRSLSYCIGLVMVVLFVYGLIRYPDLPIRECPSGYCGRQGQPHTAAEYNAFKIWQTTLFIVWPIGMLTLLLLQRGGPWFCVSSMCLSSSGGAARCVEFGPRQVSLPAKQRSCSKKC